MRLRAIITDYASRQAEIRQVRDEVFILEQKVDRAEEFDGRDQLCSHVLVFDDERPVATGRIDLEKGGKIGRVAVLQSYRRQGIGKLAMQQLEAVASEAGAERLEINPPDADPLKSRVPGVQPRIYGSQHPSCKNGTRLATSRLTICGRHAGTVALARLRSGENRDGLPFEGG